MISTDSLIFMPAAVLDLFVEAVKKDIGLQEKLKDAKDLNALLEISKEAGFEISLTEWYRYSAKQVLELNDDDLEAVAGGISRRGKRAAGGVGGFVGGAGMGTTMFTILLVI